MAAGYDGSVRIDTSIDSKGFNAGIAKISASLKSVFNAVLGKIAEIGLVVGVVVIAVAAIAAALVDAVIAIGLFAYKLTETLYKSLSSTSAYRDQVVQLKTAFDSLKGSAAAVFANLLSAISPVIFTIIGWLTKIIDLVAQYVAAFAGQTTYYKYASGSLDSSANSAGKLAKNTKKAGEAAKGALAAFDQLNVLQQNDNTDTENSTSAGGGGGLGLVKANIDQKVLDNVAKIKGFFTNLWLSVSTAASNAWQWIENTWSNVSAWFKTNIINPIVNQWNYAWDINKKIISDVWNWIVGIWVNVSTWFKTNVIDPLVNQFTYAWNFNSILAHDAWVAIQYVWNLAWSWFKKTVIDPLVSIFVGLWNNLSTGFSNIWSAIKIVWGIVAAWFKEHVGDPLQNAFGVALDWIEDKWKTAFTNIGSFVKGVINKIIDFINGMLSGFTSGINSVIGKLNTVGAKMPGWTVIPNVGISKIPYLATGAVIPPNAAFAAVLGDQRNGTNLETPVSLLEDIFDRKLDEKLSNQQISISFNGSMGALVRELKPYIDKENRRRGTNLINSGIA